MNAGSCWDTVCQTIYYLGDTSSSGAMCNAYFEVADLDTANNTVWLADFSTGGISYYWTFGDGAYSDEQYPSHTYSQDGVYLVCLISIAIAT